MENGKTCPKCHGTECVKNGIVGNVKKLLLQIKSADKKIIVK